MAGSLVLNVEILGEFKKLAEATKQSQKSLGNLDKSAKNISKGINTALGAIGIGFSLNFLVDQFKASTKAAIEDQKSKVLLTKALQDNLKATNATVNGVEKFIGKLQITTSIADDQLRPAFSKLAIATKDTDKAMRLMSIAVDVAAGTGKSLDAVVQAMSRSLAGSDTALNRLVPSVKGAADPIAELERLFKGAAEAAADTDPYARLQIIFGEIQEQIGTALLPLLNEFSDWLATPEGQEKLQEIVDGVVGMVEEFVNLTEYISNDVMPTLEQLTGEKGFGAVLELVTGIVVALGLARAAMGILALGHPYLAGLLAGLALLAGAWILLQEQIERTIDKMFEFKAASGGKTFGGVVRLGDSDLAAAGGKIGILGKNPAPKPTAASGTVQVPLGNSTITVNINGSKLTAPEIVTEIQKYSNQVGRQVLK